MAVRAQNVVTNERKDFISSIMNELEKKAAPVPSENPADAKPGTAERPTTTAGTQKRSEMGRSSVGPLKTRACGALAF